MSLSSIACALILGGAMGNLIDRALRGRVIDFMRAHYYDLNYPIFNVADSAISIGVVLIILVSFFGHDDDAEASKPESFQLAVEPRTATHLTTAPRRV